MRRLIRSLVSIAALFVPLVGVVLAAAPDANKPAAAKVRIVLVGDSTVAESSGWGPAFRALVKPTAECLNMARGGTSTKSFYEKGQWKKALAEEPQYVLIQFGHNDQPGKGPDRETDPKTTYRDNLKRFVDEARAAGAEPILITSLTRRIFTADGKIRSTLVPYVEGMKAVAAEKKVPLVDLHTRSVELCEKLGPVEARTLGPPHPDDPKLFDGTHLNAKGAAAFAAIIAEELKTMAPELAGYLETGHSQTEKKP